MMRFLSLFYLIKQVFCIIFIVLQQLKMTKIINNKGKRQQKWQNNKKQTTPKAVSHQSKDVQIDLKTLNIQELYDLAEQYYVEVKSKNKNDKWNDFISKKGTKKDKITFVAAQILKKPQCSLDHFQLLARWTMDSNHNFALPACQALSNIYMQHIFTEKASMKVFLDSVQDYIKTNKKDSKVSKGDLVGFYLEHHIKHFYGQMIRGVTELLTSEITHIKKTAIQILASLSRFKQIRRSILSTLVNKFGDNDLEVVNQVTKSLKSQFYQDIQASQTLLEQTQSFLFRQNLSQKSQFYVINFLNNINLKFFSQKSLTKLFQLFFHFFNKLMDKQSQQKSISSRLFLNSIKGLNKIFAFMKSGNKQTMSVIEQKVQTVYKTFHKTQNTKAKVQLLLFLFQSCTHLKGSISDRFYRILYEFLSSTEIIHCSIAEMFFDLLLLSMKQDQNMNRTLAFIKRILQLCFQAESNFIATCLILVSKVILEKESIQIMIKQRESSLEDIQVLTKQQSNNEKQLPYDMNKRQPLYAGAQKTNLWELTVFKDHYHPTVRKFTEHILKNEQIPYSGNNPLIELSLTSFVEKLSLRKQKKSDSWKIKMKRNLQRMRTSKYESMLEKPMQSFKQNQEFILKYLQKRESIHKNRKSMQSKDIQEFADQVIQREMDRLNPREDSQFDDLSISRQEISDQERIQEDGQDQAEDVDEDQMDEEDLEADEDLEGDEELAQGEDQLEGQQFGDFQDQDHQNDQFNDDIDQQQFDQQDSQAQQSEQVSEEKDFEDVFDDIGDEPEYSKKKSKLIQKQKKTQKFNKNAQQNDKKIKHKSVKKQFKKNVSSKKNTKKR